MKKLGRVLRVTKTGHVIVESEDHDIPYQSLEVFDDKLKVIGKIYDIIGPVNSPFISIKLNPNYRNPEKIIDKYVYIISLPSRRSK
ncbi:MAG: H/ACA ribonucleoprotein complex subunit GAR1 [Thermoprotei archaeon]